MNKRTLQILCFVIISFTAFIPFFVVAQIQAVVPTSPEAATFSKVVNYPMSTNTGLPDISIPLHEIEIGGMKLPINLSYHSGGFKIGEQSTNIGLGWSLSTDLQITRTINGMDDFDPMGYAYNTSMRPHKANDPADIYYVTPIESTTASQSYAYAAGLMDGKPDKFSYRLLNKSGSFYMLNNAGSISYIPVPYDNIKISFNQNQFTITDVDGSIYYFSLPLVIPTDTADLASVGREVTGDINFNGSQCSNCKITTWKCMKIVNPTVTDEIDFNYTAKSITTTTNSTDFAEYFNNATPNCPSLSYPNSTAVTSSTTYTNLLTHAPFQTLSSPKYIEYRDSYGTLFHMLWENPSAGNQLQDKTFTYDVLNSPARYSQYKVSGLALSSIQFRGGSVTFTGTDQLSAITINNGGQEVKTIRFYQSLAVPNNLTVARNYNGANFNGTLYLDSISMTNGASKYQTYGFQYKTKYCFGSHLKGHDAWGCVNAKTMEIAFAQLSNYPPFYPLQPITQTYFSNSCQTSTITDSLKGFGDEYPDERLMQSGMLSSILYPTGGHADFDFEANRYAYSGADVNGPYKRLLLGGGLRLQKVSYYDGINAHTPTSQQYFTYGDLEDGEGILLNPPVIKNVDGSLVYGNYSFTQSVYYGLSNAQLTNGTGAGAFPNFTQPCASNNCINLTTREDKTTYLPNSALDLTYAGGSPIYYNKVTEYNLEYGRQTGKVVHTYYPYSYIPAYSILPTTSNIINGTDNEYLHENWFLGNLQREAYFKYVPATGGFAMVHQTNYEYLPYYAPMWPRVIYSFLHNFYNVSEPGSAVAYSVYFNTPYATGAYLINTPNFIFSEDGISIGKVLMTKKTEQWADDAGDTLSNVTTYNYNSMNDVAYITTTDSKGISKLEQLKYPYDFPADSVCQHMVARNMIAPVIERIVTDGFSRQFSHEKTNYAYRNNWFYVPDSKYTSFNGHALELQTNFDQYDNFANVLGMTGRDGITKSYLWGYNSRYPVAEVTGMAYNTAVSNSGVNLTVLNSPSSDAQLMTELNKLRTMPGGPALVKSFTYKPMTGITSLTDPTGVSSYFEYDGFSRLLDIRNNDHNIITKYSYVTHGPSTAFRYYVNKPYMGTVMNCYVEPATGPGNNYIIPGGIYGDPTDWIYANNSAFNAIVNELGHPSVSTTCTNDTSVHKALISMITQIFLPGAGGVRPSGMVLELIQNGHVVATRPFAGDDVTWEYFYEPPGTYQVSFRVDPSFRYKAIKCDFYPNDGSPGSFITSGATVTLKDHVTYQFEAINFF